MRVRALQCMALLGPATEALLAPSPRLTRRRGTPLAAAPVAGASSKVFAAATGAVSRVVGHRFGGRTEAAALQAMRLANPQIEGAEQLQPWERKRKEMQEQRKKAAREKLEAEGAAGSSADDALEDAPHAELGKFQHELVVAVCCALARDASKSCALVFVPGMADIGDLTDRLEARGGAYVGDVAGNASELRRFECVPVHSELPHEDQARAFAPATDGRFKVVLATNSAESSVTLPDCDDVLDLGTVSWMDGILALGFNL